MKLYDFVSEEDFVPQGTNARFDQFLSEEEGEPETSLLGAAGDWLKRLLDKMKEVPEPEPVYGDDGANETETGFAPAWDPPEVEDTTSAWDAMQGGFLGMEEDVAVPPPMYTGITGANETETGFAPDDGVTPLTIRSWDWPAARDQGRWDDVIDQRFQPEEEGSPSPWQRLTDMALALPKRTGRGFQRWGEILTPDGLFQGEPDYADGILRGPNEPEPSDLGPWAGQAHPFDETPTPGAGQPSGGWDNLVDNIFSQPIGGMRDKLRELARGVEAQPVRADYRLSFEGVDSITPEPPPVSETDWFGNKKYDMVSADGQYRERVNPVMGPNGDSSSWLADVMGKAFRPASLAQEAVGTGIGLTGRAVEAAANGGYERLAADVGDLFLPQPGQRQINGIEDVMPRTQEGLSDANLANEVGAAHDLNQRIVSGEAIPDEFMGVPIPDWAKVVLGQAYYTATDPLTYLGPEAAAKLIPEAVPGANFVRGLVDSGGPLVALGANEGSALTPMAMQKLGIDDPLALTAGALVGGAGGGIAGGLTPRVADVSWEALPGKFDEAINRFDQSTFGRLPGGQSTELGALRLPGRGTPEPEPGRGINEAVGELANVIRAGIDDGTIPSASPRAAIERILPVVEDPEGRVRRMLNRGDEGKPKNERTVFADDQGEFVVGRITPEDWLNRIQQQLSDPEEFRAARYWYEDLAKEFEVFAPEDRDVVMLAWLLSQQRASPSKGMQDVLRAEETGRYNLPVLKQAGLNAEALTRIFSGTPIEKGVGQKLFDFLDSGRLKETRTIMGDNPAGGAPAVVDIWSARDYGMVDGRVLEYVRQRFGPEAAAKIREDFGGSGLTETAYEQGAAFYRGLADYLNEIGFDGGGWKPHQIQAAGWMAIQKAMGVVPESAPDIFAKNTQRISFELAFGEGSPLAQKHDFYALAPHAQQEVTTEVLTKITDWVTTNIPTARVRAVIDAPGGWLEYPVSPSWQLEVLASPETVLDVAESIGFLAQQTGMVVARPLKSGKTRGFDILYPPGRSNRDVNFVTEFWTKLREIEPELAQGFQPASVGDRDGMRLLDLDRKWKPKDIGRLEAAVEAVEAQLGLADVETSYGTFDTTFLGNNWVEDGEGNGYTQGILGRGRPALERALRDIAPERDRWVDEAFARHGASAAPAELDGGPVGGGEQGSVSAGIAGRLAVPAAGATYGYLTGDDEQDRLERALKFGGAGAGLAFADAGAKGVGRAIKAVPGVETGKTYGVSDFASRPTVNTAGDLVIKQLDYGAEIPNLVKLAKGVKALLSKEQAQISDHPILRDAYDLMEWERGHARQLADEALARAKTAIDEHQLKVDPVTGGALKEDGTPFYLRDAQGNYETVPHGQGLGPTGPTGQGPNSAPATWADVGENWEVYATAGDLSLKQAEGLAKLDLLWRPILEQQTELGVAPTESRPRFRKGTKYGGDVPESFFVPRGVPNPQAMPADAVIAGRRNRIGEVVPYTSQANKFETGAHGIAQGEQRYPDLVQAYSQALPNAYDQLAQQGIIKQMLDIPIGKDGKVLGDLVVPDAAKKELADKKKEAAPLRREMNRAQKQAAYYQKLADTTTDFVIRQQDRIADLRAQAGVDLTPTAIWEARRNALEVGRDTIQQALLVAKEAERELAANTSLRDTNKYRLQRLIARASEVEKQFNELVGTYEKRFAAVDAVQGDANVAMRAVQELDEAIATAFGQPLPGAMDDGLLAAENARDRHNATLDRINKKLDIARELVRKSDELVSAKADDIERAQGDIASQKAAGAAAKQGIEDAKAKGTQARQDVRRGAKELVAAGDSVSRLRESYGAVRELTKVADSQQRRADVAQGRADRWGAEAGSLEAQLKPLRGRIQTLVEERAQVRALRRSIEREAHGTLMGVAGDQNLPVLDGAPVPLDLANSWNQYIKPIGEGEGAAAKAGATLGVLNSVWRNLGATADASWALTTTMLGGISDPEAYAKAAKTGADALLPDKVRGQTFEESFSKYIDQKNAWAKAEKMPSIETAIGHDLQVAPAEATFIPPAGQDGDSIAGALKDRRFSDAIAQAPVIKQSGQSFTGATNRMRIEMFYNLLEDAKDAGRNVNDPGVIAQAAAAANSIGGRSNTGFGASVGGLDILENKGASGVWFAGRYLQSTADTVLNAFLNGDLAGNQARTALARLAIGGAMVAVIANEMQGEVTSFDPHDPNFMRVRIGGYDVPVLGPWNPVAKMALFGASGILKGAEGDFDGAIAEEAEALKLLRNKLSPAGKVIVDLVSGSDAIGNSTREMAYWFQPFSGAAYPVPFVARAIAEDMKLTDWSDPYQWFGSALNVLGGQASPLTEMENAILSDRHEGLFVDPLTGEAQRPQQYSDLDPAQRKEFALRHPEIFDRESDDPVAKALDTLKSRKDVASVQFEAGDMTVKEWRARRSDIGKATGELLSALTEDGRAVPESGPGEWAHSYYQAFADATDPVSGELDNDKLEQLQSEFWAKHSDPKVRAYIYRLTGVTDSEAEKAYHDDLIRLSGFDPETGEQLLDASGKPLPSYWDLRDQRYALQKLTADDIYQLDKEFEDWSQQPGRRKLPDDREAKLAFLRTQKGWTMADHPAEVTDYVYSWGSKEAERPAYKQYVNDHDAWLVWFNPADENDTWETVQKIRSGAK